MQLDISSDGHHAVPWQHVLAPSILELMMHLDTWLTLQMQALCRKLRPSLGSTFHIASRLIVISMNVNTTERWVLTSRIQVFPMDVAIILRPVITAFRFLGTCQLINSLYSCKNSQVASAVHGLNVPHRAPVLP
jgi:hypothetical protein